MKPSRIKPTYAFAVVDKRGEILRLALSKEVASVELTDLLGGTDLTDLRVEPVHVRPTTARDIGRL